MDPEMLDLRVLLVEDDADTRSELASFLRLLVREVVTAADGNAGLEAFRAHAPDVVVTDVRMPGMDGLTMTARIRELSPDALVIVTTAHSESQLLFRAIEAGIDRYVVKPVDGQQLVAALGRCSQVVSLRRATKALSEERERLIAELTASLAKIKRLSGLLPICASCKRIRNDAGFWQQIEAYIHEHSEADFTHGVCPECFDKLCPPRVT